MARHTQPRERAELTGATRKNPQYYRNTPPKSDLPLGDPPEHLGKEARACWFEISALALPGVLTGTDRLFMEIAANYLAEYRADPVAFSGAKMTHMRGILAEMGYSMSARQKMDIPERDSGDDFEDLG